MPSLVKMKVEPLTLMKTNQVLNQCTTLLMSCDDIKCHHKKYEHKNILLPILDTLKVVGNR
jgi:hypothetical protein